MNWLILTLQKKTGRGSKGRMELILEDGRVIELSEELVWQSTLREGGRVEEERLEELRFEDERKRCQEAGMRLLNVRPRTRTELRRALRQRKFSKPAVEGVLDRFEELGWLNDKVFAKLFTEEHLFRKRSGPRLVRNQLLQRGVERETVEEMVRESFSAEQVRENALELIRKWNRRSKPEDPRKRRQAAWSYLMNRGYDSDVAREVIEEVLGADDI